MHNDTPLSPPVRRPSEAVANSRHQIKDGLGRPSYEGLLRAFHRDSMRRLGFGVLVAICFGSSPASRGEELPVQKALAAMRNSPRYASRENREIAAAYHEKQIAKLRQEELPPGRARDPAFDDPFADEYGNIQSLPNHSLLDDHTSDDIWLDEFDDEGASGGLLASRTWARADYLIWWVEGFSVPPLVTTSPTGTARTEAGQLDQATTTILFGNEKIVDFGRPSGRIGVGRWLDHCQSHGIEASYLRLGSRHETFAASSPGDPILARPFFNAEPGFEGPDAELVAFPGLLQGNIAIDGQSSFEVAEALYRHVMIQECDYQIDLLIGWRLNRLNDDLTIRDSKTSIGAGGPIALGTTIDELDHFRTRNVFHGVELGMVATKNCCDWMFEMSTKVALGNTRSRYIIDGSTTVTVPVPGAAPAVAVTSAGLLTQGTNVGVYSDDEFAVIPEVGLVAGYQVSPNCRVTMGYTFIYWNHVARAGDSIDTQLNLSQLAPGGLVGPAHPAFAQTTSSFWAQGVNLGLDVQF